jgi:hypothetical protein
MLAEEMGKPRRLYGRLPVKGLEKFMREGREVPNQIRIGTACWA